MRAPLHASATDRPLPRFGVSRWAWSPPRGDDPDRLRPFHDDLFAFSISAPHPVAPGLVVGPDDVRDVGVGNERYDAVTPSGSGVGSEVDGGQCKSSCRPRFRLRASAPGRPQEPLYAHSAPASDETVRPSVSSRSSRRKGWSAILSRGSVGTPEWLYEPAEALVIP